MGYENTKKYDTSEMAVKKQSPEKTVKTLLQDVACAMVGSCAEQSKQVIIHFWGPNLLNDIYYNGNTQRTFKDRREKFIEVALGILNCTDANPVKICGLPFYNLRMRERRGNHKRGS